MKSVDITLFFQAASFFITYLILRRYVFVPASQILEVQEEQDQLLQRSIHEALSNKEQLAGQLKARMLQIKGQLRAYIPSKKSQILQNQSGIPQVQNGDMKLSDGEIKKIKKIITDTIVEVKV